MMIMFDHVLFALPICDKRPDGTEDEIGGFETKSGLSLRHKKT